MAESINQRIENMRRVENFCEAPPFPKVIKIDTCNICNYRCIFCPDSIQGKRYGKIGHELCLRLIKEGYEAGARECSLAGTGEPLLNEHLEEYISFARKTGYEYIFLNTNGYLATPDRIEKIIDAGPSNIKFSMNCGREKYKLVHGVDAYDRVMDNIRSAVEYRNKSGSKCRIFVSFLATKLTVGDAEGVGRELKGIADEFYVMNITSRGGILKAANEELFMEKDEYSHKYPCSQMFKNAYVTSEGYMTICCQVFDNEVVIADLNKTTLLEAWNCERFREVRRKHINMDFAGMLCDNCLNDKNDEVARIPPENMGYPIDEGKKADVGRRIRELGIKNNNCQIMGGRAARVLLIGPNIEQDQGRNNGIIPLVGLGCLAAVLRDYGYEVFVRDTALEGYDNRRLIPDKKMVLVGETDEQIADYVREICPDIVGISAILTAQHEIVRHTAKLVKSVSRDIYVVVGGSHVTGLVKDYFYAKSKNMNDSHYERILRSMLGDSNIDFAMIGESDYEFPKLVECLLAKGDINLIKNLAYFDEHKEFQTTASPESECYNTIKLNQVIPNPAWELLNMKKYFELGLCKSKRSVGKMVYPTMATRGCPESCSFCSATNTFGRKVRWREPVDIAQEIRSAIKNYGEIEEIQFLDDNITAHLGNLYKLCDELEKLGLRWCTPNGIKANYHMDKQPDYFKRMKESGCYQVTIAAETGNQEIMDNIIHKNLRLDEIAKSIENAKSAGLYVHTFWIVGFPYQTRESMEETILFAASTGADSFSVNLYSPLPGTTLARTVIDNNLFWSDETDMTHMNTSKSLIRLDGFDGPEEVESWVARQTITLNELLYKKDPERFLAYESL